MEISFDTLQDVLRRRWKLMVILCLAVTLPVLVIAMTKATPYRASAKILLENSRRVNLELSTQMSEHAEKFAVPPERMNSQVEIIKSTQLLAELVRRLDPAKNPNEVTGEISRLQRQIEAKVIPASTVIEVSYSDPNPEMATRVVSTLVDIFRDYHRKVLLGDDNVAFYKIQFDQVDRRFKEDSARLNALRVQYGLLSEFSHEQKQIHERLANLIPQLTTHDLRVEETAARLRMLREQQERTPKTVKASVEMIQNPESVALVQRLATLELERNTLVLQYMPESREVKDKTAEVNAAKSRLNITPPLVEGKNVLNINPEYQAIERDLVAGQVDLEGLKQARSRLREEIAGNQMQLARLNEHAYEITTMEQVVAEDKKMHGYYLAKLDDADFVDKMTRAEISTMSLVQAAGTFPGERKPFALSLALALALGLMVSAGCALMLEKFRPRFWNGEQIRDRLNLPVLSTITSKRMSG